jgi:hypothetical protein
MTHPNRWASPVDSGGHGGIPVVEEARDDRDGARPAPLVFRELDQPSHAGGKTRMSTHLGRRGSSRGQKHSREGESQATEECARLQVERPEGRIGAFRQVEQPCVSPLVHSRPE